MSDVTLRALLLGDDRSASSAMRGVAREIDKVVERLMTLSRMDATPEVKVKTAEAQAELARLQAEMKSLGTETEKVGTETEKLGRKSETTHKQMGALATTVLALGPALVPLAAGAVGLAAGWSAMGAAGILAFVGVRNEMQAGTVVGQRFSAGVDTMKGDLQKLSAVAAANVLGPFEQTIAGLQRRMPVLTGMVGEFSTMTGKTAANVTTGLVSAFIALEPLMRDVGAYTVNLSQHFASLMGGQGIVSFGDYARSVLPQVLATLESIVTSAAHLVAAFAPLGMGTLSTVRMLSDVINAFPVSVLSVVATLAGSAFLGFRAWSGLSVPIDALRDKLSAIGPLTQTAATGLRALQAAAGVVGIAVAALSFVVSANAEDARKAEEATNRYADALRASNGAIDESVRLKTSQALADAGVLDAARKLGIVLPDVTSAALGNADAQARINAVLDAQSSKLKVTTTGAKSGVQANTELGDAADKVTKAIHGENDALAAGIQKNKDVAAAAAANKDATANVSVETLKLASAYGVSLATYQAVAASQQANADAAAQATYKMQLENDAAGILKQSLDKLNGKSLSAADAQNAFDSSLANMGDHVTATGKKIHFTTTNIGDMSAASVALRGQLNGQIGNLQRVVEANGGLTNSTGKARDQMIKMRQQIIDNAVAHGVDRAAVTAYIDKLLKIPKKVPPTQVDVNKAAAEAKAKEFIGVINGVPTFRSTTFQVRTEYVTTGKPNAPTAGNLPSWMSKHARGGSNLPAGWSLVGEEGPELMYVPGGSTILDAQKTSGALSGAGSGAGMPGSLGATQPVIVQFMLDGRVVQQSLLKLKRNQGGAALGLG